MNLEPLEPSPTGTWREAEVERRTDKWMADHYYAANLPDYRLRIMGIERIAMIREAKELVKQFPDRRDEIRLHYGLG